MRSAGLKQGALPGHEVLIRARLIEGRLALLSRKVADSRDIGSPKFRTAAYRELSPRNRDLDPAAAVLIVGRRVNVEYHNTERPRLSSWDEVMKLAEALDGSVKTAYLLSARAGLRPSRPRGM